ncbi:MAG: ATP-binding protein [Clostridia bacterium]|nr:ATP-binding protein [Clostridia bacterium]
MRKDTQSFRYITKSKFVRSIFLQVLSIFLTVSIAIVAIVFFSFASEINKNIIADKQKQLAMIEDTISKRMAEISSIAYNVGQDPAFYLEPVAGEKYSGYEMSNTLARYLIGNGFIEHLAYYRLSEPDKIYTSKGEIAFGDFWSTYLGLDKAMAETYIRQIQSTTSVQVTTAAFDKAGKSYFTYICPLPQFSKNPQAFVLMLIPVSEVAPLLEAQLMNSNGVIAVYDAGGEEIYRLSTLEADVPLELNAQGDTAKEAYVTVDGREYVVQRQVSPSNGWTYVSAIRLNDMISGLANKQLVFIILLLVLMFVAIFAMLICIVVQYKPISNLAAAVTEDAAGEGRSVIDENSLLSSTFATLKGDSEQKQHFETAYHEAEAANKAKSAFLSSVSHDIRTPMNAIIGMSAIAYKHADEPSYVRECLQKVQAASQYLLDIINNVLDMSRIEAGRFTFSKEVIELPKLIHGLAAILQPSVEAKGQTLTVEAEGIRQARVIGDNVRLTQVFVNILSNSVKFTPAGGRISLRVRQAPAREKGFGTYIFTLSDTGIGMSPAFVDQVFDTFTRAEEADGARVEGTGLGMAIAKNLVELMGGTIRCESELGKGTTFTVTMHMQLAPESEEACAKRAKGYAAVTAQDGAPADAAAIDLGGKRILLAEDNALNREIACTIIGETKAEITAVTNGQEALHAFQTHAPGYFDVILMDMQMPVMDGCAAAARIRALPRDDAARIPIYALTASTFDEDVQQAMEAGMNGHIGKPYTPEELYAVLEGVLLA